MPPKPERTIADKVVAGTKSIADEANVWLMRRRKKRRPFIRLQFAGGRTASIDPRSERGEAIATAANAVIDAAEEEQSG